MMEKELIVTMAKHNQMTIESREVARMIGWNTKLVG